MSAQPRRIQDAHEDRRIEQALARERVTFRGGPLDGQTGDVPAGERVLHIPFAAGLSSAGSSWFRTAEYRRDEAGEAFRYTGDGTV